MSKLCPNALLGLTYKAIHDMTHMVFSHSLQPASSAIIVSDFLHVQRARCIWMDTHESHWHHQCRDLLTLTFKKGLLPEAVHAHCFTKLMSTTCMSINFMLFQQISCRVQTGMLSPWVQACMSPGWGAHTYMPV